MKTQRISKRQALLIAITSITAAVFQPLFRDFLLWSGNAAWVPILAATGFGVIVLWLTLTLASRFPKQSLTEYAPEVWGPILGYPMVLLFLLVFFLKATFALRNISEFFISAVLPETPISAVMLVMLLLVAAGILSQLEGLVRFNQLALPFVVAGFALAFLGSAPAISAWNLLPLWNKGFSGMLHTFQVAGSYMMAITFIVLIYPNIVDKDRIQQEGAKTIALAGLTLLAIYLNIILFLAPGMGVAFTWPYLVVTENILIGLERGEALFMVIWTFAAFVKIALFFYLFALGISQMFPKVKLWWVGLASLPIAAYVAILPDNLPSALVDHSLLHRTSLLVEVGVPVLTLGVAVLRKKRGAA